MDLKISFCLMATIFTMVPIIIIIIIIAAGPNLALAVEAKEESSMMNSMSIDSNGISQIATSITEWFRIGALTITTGVLLLFGNKIILTKNVNNRNSHRIMETKVSMVDIRSTSPL